MKRLATLALSAALVSPAMGGKMDVSTGEEILNNSPTEKAASPTDKFPVVTRSEVQALAENDVQAEMDRVLDETFGSDPSVDCRQHFYTAFSMKNVAPWPALSNDDGYSLRSTPMVTDVLCVRDDGIYCMGLFGEFDGTENINTFVVLGI